MTVQEKVEQLKRAKTPHSTEELHRLGWSRYEKIRGVLEATCHGDYVMLEVDSGNYFVGKSPEEALRLAQTAHPDKAFYLIRIGHKAARKLR